MDIEEFVQHFTEQFDDAEEGDITADSEFKKLDEWSSLIALSIIAMVDEEYDVALKGDDIRNASTVRDLFELVQSKR